MPEIWLLSAKLSCVSSPCGTLRKLPRFDFWTLSIYEKGFFFHPWYVIQSMKMIASTKLAKAQRAMQVGKKYGLANQGSYVTYLYHCRAQSLFQQRSLSTFLPTNLHPTSCLLSFPRIRVFVVVFTLPSPRPPVGLSLAP